MTRNFIKEYLDAGHTKADLSDNFGIRFQECDGLTVYKYDQIESPKAEQIVRQARGIILDDKPTKSFIIPSTVFLTMARSSKKRSGLTGRTPS